ncbi:MAG: CrcB family protein [Phycisphaerales bacterium]|nr:MAG: CrcB family protein [Phycisphaerales bacterium]
MSFLAVGAGGAIGAVLRHGANLLALRWSAHPALATLVVNVVGSLLLGLLLWFAAARHLVPGHEPPRRAMIDGALRDFLKVGLLGGLTTFSTLTAEANGMLHEGRYAWAAAYAVGSLALGLLAAGAGFALGRVLAP